MWILNTVVGIPTEGCAMSLVDNHGDLIFGSVPMCLDYFPVEGGNMSSVDSVV